MSDEVRHEGGDEAVVPATPQSGDAQPRANEEPGREEPAAPLENATTGTGEAVASAHVEPTDAAGVEAEPAAPEAAAPGAQAVSTDAAGVEAEPAAPEAAAPGAQAVSTDAAGVEAEPAASEAAAPGAQAVSTDAAGVEAAAAGKQSAEEQAVDSTADSGSASDAEVAATAAEKKARQARVAPLYRAFRGHRRISGRVEKTIKGGYEIRIGKARAFCPHSQIDLKRVDDPESLLGTHQMFRITQLRRGGDDVVVSRRAVLEEERLEEAAAVRATLIEGAVMLGRVSGLAKFGAFVDLGAGVTGLVHLTELSHGHLHRVDQAVHVGEAVRVKILKLQGEGNRISLSIRQASEDPWASVPRTFQKGEAYPGKVLRLAEFGAFVELAPGVEALAPAGEFPPCREGWKEGMAPGSEHTWRVLHIDPEQRRISLTLKGDAEPPSLPELAPGVELTGKVQRIERFGVFVWLGPGRVGLIPGVLTGTPPGTDLQRHFPIASDIEVEVVELDERGRIRLAKKGVSRGARGDGDARSQRRERPRRKESRARSERIPAAPMSDSSAGFGSLLADKLKDALR